MKNEKLKLYQKLLIFCVVCSALYYSAIISIINFVDLNEYKKPLFEEIQRKTDFIISCENIKFEKTLIPKLKISMFHTAIFYPNNDLFLKVKNADFEIKLLPLFLKKIEIKNTNLVRPVVNLTFYKDFSTSLDRYFINKNKNNLINFILLNVNCQNYKIKIFDNSINKLLYLEGKQFLLKELSSDGKMKFKFDGALYENKNSFLNYDLHINSNFKNNIQKFTFSPFKTILKSKIKGSVTGKLTIDRDKKIVGNLIADNISLKLDDVFLKNNKTIMNFNGEEVQIQGVLHTSDKDCANINGKFNYGKKKSLNFSTNAKNININVLHKMCSVIFESLNIPNNLKDYNLDGILNADFSIKSDFKKLKSSGNFKINNAKISYKNLPYQITNINSDIDLSGNKVNINFAKAMINNIPVNVSGVINEDISVDLIANSENLDLKTIATIFKFENSLPFSIKNGILSFQSKIQGKLNKKIISKSNIIISNGSFLENITKLPLSFNNAKVNLSSENEMFSGDIVLENLKSKFDNILVSAKEIKINFDDKKISIPQHELIIENSPIYITGHIFNYLINPIADFKFNSDFKSITLQKILKNYTSVENAAKGIIKAQGSILYKDKTTDLKLKLNADSENYLSFAVIKELLNKPSYLNIDCSLKNNNLEIKDINLYKKSDIENSSVNKIIDLKGKINFEKGLTFQDLKIKIPNPISFSTNFSGGENIMLQADLSLNNTAEKPKIKGVVNLNSLDIKNYLTLIKNSDLIFDNEKLSIIMPDVQIGSSKFNITTEVNLNNLKNIIISKMQLNCLNLDLNSLLENFRNFKQSDEFSKITIKNGVAKINNFKVADLKARDISTDFEFSNDMLNLKNISAIAYAGNISGNLSYSIKNNLLKIMLEGQKINLKESLYDLCKFDDNLAGKVDFTTDLSLVPDRNPLNSLKGDVDFTSYNGKMGTLGKFEYYLSAQNILYHGFLKANLNRILDAITKNNNTAQYKISKGTLSFANGYLFTNELFTQGYEMSLYVNGKQNLISNQAIFEIYGRISDEISKKLGTFGDVSISDFMENKQNKTINYLFVPAEIVEKVPNLINEGNKKTNMFKVNISGKVGSLNSIKSFVWILPKEEKNIFHNGSDEIF